MKWSWLIAITLLGLVAAWWAVMADRQRETKRYFEPQLLFPALAEKLEDVDAIRLEVGRGLAGVKKITLVRTSPAAAHQDKKKKDVFRVLESGSYVARADMIRRLMSGMANLKVIAPRSATREGHQRLGLLAPEELGPSVRITFYDRGQSIDGKTRRLPAPASSRASSRAKIASVLIGKRPEGLGDVLGQSSVYVRRAGEKQSWLARGSLPLKLEVHEWLDLDFFQRLLAKPIDGQDFVVARAQFVPFGRKAWRITRAERGQDFSLTNHRGIPPRGIVDGRRVRQTSLALKNLTFQDVRPASDFRFRRQNTAIYESFSGLAIVFEIIAAPRGYWARINVRATARRAEPHAQSLQQQLKGFVFLLDPKTARIMTLPVEVLMKKSSRRKRNKKSRTN